MLTGRYLLTGHDGPYAIEDFRCSGEPEGWSYRAVRRHPETGALLGECDLVLATDGRIRRLQQTAGGWLLRGGVVGHEVRWRRGEQEHVVAAHGFTGSSPAFAVACSRRATATDDGSLRLVEVHDAVLATSTVDQVWTGAGDTWTSVDRATGSTSTWLLADGLVRTGPGVILLEP